jgi:hypothetical protein
MAFAPMHVTQQYFEVITSVTAANDNFYYYCRFHYEGGTNNKTFE